MDHYTPDEIKFMDKKISFFLKSACDLYVSRGDIYPKMQYIETELKKYTFKDNKVMSFEYQVYPKIDIDTPRYIDNLFSIDIDFKELKNKIETFIDKGLYSVGVGDAMLNPDFANLLLEIMNLINYMISIYDTELDLDPNIE